MKSSATQAIVRRPRSRSRPMSANDSKYTRIEYERRFLVRADSGWLDRVDPVPRVIDDKYLRDTRLRLRIVTESQSGHRTIKLTKKAESASPYFTTISRILLSPHEYVLFDAIAGDRLTKRRFYYTERGRRFAIDRFEDALEGLVLCEIEADALDDLMGIDAPDFVQQEVTEDPFFNGSNLCRTTWEDLLARLASIAACCPKSVEG
jgi:CYTH domain-containing protein